MAGGLMQLVAYGAQDVYLTGAPKVTFFQAVYKKHTNFAMETIEQTVNGTPSAGGRVSVTVARNGDLVGEMFLELKSKQTNANLQAWTAESQISSVELTIGGQRVDKQYQRWWRLYSELYMDESRKLNYGKMTTGSNSNTVYLPLLFFFNRNPGLFLPLIALQYHEVRLDFDLSADFNNSFKCWANYVFLDTEERRRFAQKGHEYLIEQVQHTGVDTVDTSEKSIRLSYNHPVKELVWCIAKTGNRPYALTRTDWDAAIAGANAPAGAQGAPVSSAALLEETHGSLENLKLVLNGQDRFKVQGAKYFNQVQPFYHHSGAPMPGVYSYSFALKPEEHQPTGTCNFSRIDNAQVYVKAQTGATQLHMFAVNYNVLRIQSGMGGLAFSN
jgi:hypothetical protein